MYIKIEKIEENRKCACIRVNHKVYSLDTIFAAGYVFLDRAYILLDRKEKYILIYLIPQKEEKDLRRMGLEFYNELLNYAHYSSRAKANAEIVKVIMQRVLFSVSPSLAKEAVKEAEEKEIQELISELEKEEGMSGLSEELENEHALKKRKR